MIASLTGKVLRKSAEHVVIDVSGVGYRVFVTPLTLDRLGEPGKDVTLETHTAVREDNISLYGFLDLQECRLFQLLLGVTGVGPKLALAILSHASWQEVVQAVGREDIARLRSIKGIGERTAKLLVLGLKKKVEDLSLESRSHPEAAHVTAAPNLAHDAEAALLGLGYSRPEVERTLSRLDWSSERDLQWVVKESLKLLSGRSAQPGAPR